MHTNSAFVRKELIHNRRFNAELNTRPKQDSEDHVQAEHEHNFIRSNFDLPELMFRARSMMI